MTQLSMFETKMPKGAGETGRPIDVGDAHQPVRASSDHAVDAECAPGGSAIDGVRRARGSEIPPLSSDVKRIITHKIGLFTQLLGGKPTGREFRLIELYDGSTFAEFTDGEREAVDQISYQSWITLGFRNGSLIEVAP